MADIVVELRAVVVADVDIAATLGQRFYQDRLPQGVATLPAIVAEEISGLDMQEIGGVVVLRRSRVRVKCYADSPFVAAQLRRAVSELVATARGAWGDLFINAVELAGRGSGIDEPIAADDVWRPYKFQDFSITHRG